MGSNTKIEWTDSTWNPLIGCSRVSEGCRNCYAERQAHRFQHLDSYSYTTHTVNGHPAWTGKVNLAEKHLLDPLKWGPVRLHGPKCGKTSLGKQAACTCWGEEKYATRPRRIFVNSMSDLFHPSVPDEWIDRIFAVMALCPQHIFQVLTKRPERMLAYLKQVREERDMQRWVNAALGFENVGSVLSSAESWQWPLPNVWLGVSVENQAAADERIPLLLQTPAAVRFVSCEPLLGPVDLSCVPWPAGFPFATDGPGSDGFDALRFDDHNSLSRLANLDWVICGGESGPRARPMHPDWARSLRDQCANARVPFFFKQWGDGWRRFNDYEATRAGFICKDHHGGALLDGVEHKAFPG